MAVITGITTADVGWVLARGGDAIVAGTTGTDDLGVINRVGRYPDDVVVTVLAQIRGLDMRQALASGCRAVVAVNTVAADVDVIEVRR